MKPTSQPLSVLLGKVFSADPIAKRALSRHSAAAPQDLEELDRKIGIAKHVLKLGAAVLLQWPLLEFRGCENSLPRPRLRNWC
eukprot:7010230-Pyramimonas_sp.AAC.1